MAATPADEFETAAGRVPLPPWPLLETLPAVLQAGTDPVAGFRAALGPGPRWRTDSGKNYFFVGRRIVVDYGKCTMA
jgi:hypothetical protein